MDEKLKELRKVVRDYLRAIQHVPMRAVDCDQDREERLWAKLAKLSGYGR